MADQSQASRPGQAFGAQVRASAITGPAIGRDHPIYPIELMPYAFLDNNLFFTDIRGFTDTINGWGGNFGGGYRRYLPAFDRILGINGYYDYDATSGATFRELGFGVESLGALYDIRANAYFPTGSTKQLLGLVNVDGTQVFQGHQLLTNQLATYVNALHGFDSEIGVPIPGRIPERHDIRVFGGGYWFEGQTVASFGGWKTRIQANVIPSIALNLQISHDELFKTNVVFGATWSFGGYKQGDDEKKSQFSRMTAPVVRQYNMVVGKTYETVSGVTVLNPLTNQPYFFEHVSNPANSGTTNTGNGTIENPFTGPLSFQNAQSALTASQGVPNSNDIIFVHGNSVFGSSGSPATTVNLQENVTVLGEATGLDHFIATTMPNNISAFGDSVRLPHPTNAPIGGTVARPVFQFTNGNGVVLANNSVFDGFQIGSSTNAASGPTGIGIVGDGITNAIVRRTDVNNSGGNGVLLNNTSGTITFQGDTINTPVGNASTFVVTNTAKTGVINFTQDEQPLPSGVSITTPGTINYINPTTGGLGGMALLVEGTQSGSVVNFTGSTINDTNDKSTAPINIQSDAGTVILGDANIQNGAGFGLFIVNDSGIVNGNGLITIGGKTTSGTAIAGTADDAIFINQLQSTGKVNFTSPGVNLTGTAIPLFNNYTGTVLFTEPNGSNGTGTTAGINISNQLSRGINLIDNQGNVTFGTPVTIMAASQNAAQKASIEYQGSSGSVQFASTATLKINNGGTGILINPEPAATSSGSPTPNTGTFSVNSATTITNAGLNGIEVTGDKSTVVFGSGQFVNINQAANIGIEILANSGPVSFFGTTTVNNADPVTIVTPTGTTTTFPPPGVDIRGNDGSAAVVNFNTLVVNNASGPATAPFGGIGVNIGSNTNSADFNKASVDITKLIIQTAAAGTAENGPALFVSHEGNETTTTPAGLTTSTGLTIQGGLITNTFGQAVEMNNSSLNVILNAVNSANSSTFGIDLVNNQPLVTNTVTAESVTTQLTNYLFQLENINVTTRSSGIIQGAGVAGINIVQNNALFQTGAFNIQQVALNNNQFGLVGDGLLSLNVGNSSFFQSTHDGIKGTNIEHVLVQTSLFQNNGTIAADSTNPTVLADNAIYLTANSPLLNAQNTSTVTPLPTNGQYQWYILNNNQGGTNTGGFFGAQNSGDIVRVDSGTNPQNLQVQLPNTSNNVGAPIRTAVTALDFRFSNNFMNVQDPTLATVVNQANYINGVHVNWTGEIASTSFISQNTVQLQNYDRAFAITNSDLIQLTSMSINNNLVTLAATGSTVGITGQQIVDYGLYVNNTDPTQLVISGNTFTFQRGTLTGGNQDLGMAFNVTNQTTTDTILNISNNIITMGGNDRGDQGIVFQTLQAPASVGLSGNTISVTDFTTNAAVGINFQTVIGNIGLFGINNNAVSINGSTNGGNGAPWVEGISRSNTTAGSEFFVNGFTVP